MVVLRWFDHRLADKRIRSHVNDRVDTIAAQRFFNQPAIEKIPLHEHGIGRDHLAVSLHEVVVDDGLVSGPKRLFDDNATDISRTTCNKNVHTPLVSGFWFLVS